MDVASLRGQGSTVDSGERPDIPGVLEAVRLAQGLLSDLDLNAVLNRVVESAAALSGARQADATRVGVRQCIEHTRRSGATSRCGERHHGVRDVERPRTG